MALWDVPFELVGEVARAGAMAEAGDVEGGAAAARHVGAGIRAECGCSDTDALVETGRGGAPGRGDGEETVVSARRKTSQAKRS